MMTPEPWPTKGEVRLLLAFFVVLLALAIVGVVSTLNAFSPVPPCRCDCCACDAGPPPDPLDEHSTIVIPSPFPERK